MSDLIDVRAFKRLHPLAEVAGRYGVELRPSGRALLGRCPFHRDHGRPNFYVYPAPDVADDSFFCYRCPVGGDVIRFVELLERVKFKDAVARLSGNAQVAGAAVHAAACRPRSARRTVSDRAQLGPLERACLAAAVELYANRLDRDVTCRRYLDSRGIQPATAQSCRLGYAAGDELVAYLRWRRLPVYAAHRAGLLTTAGHELLAGRIVIPEIRAGQPIWLIGRTLPGGCADRDESSPRYLGLPGCRPLMGWETAATSLEPLLVEGPFDWLVLRQWGLPALALCGTHFSGQVLRALTRFRRLRLLLDNDQPGQDAAERLSAAFGDRVIVLHLPGVKDVAELATRPDGRRVLDASLRTWQPAAA
jgi:DNA primase